MKAIYWRCALRKREVGCMYVQSLQLCPTLCGPMDCSPPGSSIHGILQVRIVEWVSMPSSRKFPHSGINPHLLHGAGKKSKDLISFGISFSLCPTRSSGAWIIPQFSCTLRQGSQNCIVPVCQLLVADCLGGGMASLRRWFSGEGAARYP